MWAIEKLRWVLICCFLLSLLTLGSCSWKDGDNHAEARAECEKTIRIDRFETEVKKFASLDSVGKAKFKGKYVDVFKVLYKGADDDTMVMGIPQSRIYEAFSKEVTNQFASSDSIKALLSSVDAKLPRIVTVISPFNQSIMLTDSCMLIALNHYLGANHPMYGYYDEYLRKYKCRERLPFDVAEVLSRDQVGEQKKHSSLLDYMIYEGAVTINECRILGNSTVEDVLMYSKAESEWCEKSIQNVWQMMVSRDIVYSSDYLTIMGMIHKAPFSMAIAQDTPPMLGRYIGYQIVRHYLEQNKNATLEQIISTPSQEILLKSKYNGR